MYIYTVNYTFQEKSSREPLGPEMEQCAWHLRVLTWVSEQMKSKYFIPRLECTLQIILLLTKNVTKQ